ncbi:hypothetical protein D915_010734 [Fasciola hepatica]|uniref:Uncharacterized protein n=1 Tax=Fasciola hepatica TaxID=6192 RepID=A0A4E0QY19_FASHE|nr:hypothetical protein D915_010734 [Fasciola hepatica]
MNVVHRVPGILKGTCPNVLLKRPSCTKMIEVSLFSDLTFRPQDVLIIGTARTPIVLGGFAIKAAVKRSKVDPVAIQECYMGLVSLRCPLN